MSTNEYYLKESASHGLQTMEEILKKISVRQNLFDINYRLEERKTKNNALKICF